MYTVMMTSIIVPIEGQVVNGEWDQGGWCVGVPFFLL